MLNNDMQRFVDVNTIPFIDPAEIFSGLPIKVGVVNITPIMAGLWLESSPGNRSESTDRIDTYVRDMTNGKWKLNGETIVLDDKGQLRQGHHRLKACVKANVPFWSFVVWGLPEDQTNIFDIGRPRSIANILQLEGKPYATNVMVAIARMHFKVAKNIFVPSSAEIDAFLERNAKELEIAYSATCNGDYTTRKASVIYALFAAYKCGVPERTLRRFAAVANTGVCQSKDETPAIKLREHLMRSTARGKNGQRMATRITENAVKDFVDGKYRVKAYPLDCKSVYSSQRIIRLL